MTTRAVRRRSPSTVSIATGWTSSWPGLGTMNDGLTASPLGLGGRSVAVEPFGSSGFDGRTLGSGVTVSTGEAVTGGRARCRAAGGRWRVGAGRDQEDDGKGAGKPAESLHARQTSRRGSSSGLSMADADIRRCAGCHPPMESTWRSDDGWRASTSGSPDVLAFQSAEPSPDGQPAPASESIRGGWAASQAPSSASFERR